MSKFYISAGIITTLNCLLLIISAISIYYFNIEVKFGVIYLPIFLAITLVVILAAILFRFLILKIKQFSITDHWIESIKLHLLFVSSVGQEIFFRGILNQILGIYISTLIYTFWNFLPSKKRIGVIIFFFFMGLIQSQIYFYTNNILYVIYTNFLFHILIRVIKYKI